ncbi:hypothetical protein M407DRAFT_19474 [Tulasnella calospora MUT 4182]|uniref:Uncharacterized protein n=1 Tax=Tulasnella calospora MUT 4182 TaxID=1051891 RepID=A0A0C3MCN9_9AGAM|nr:hypothetical protein M407DRAFT_19474 [Tulasnella calospora MUT 4182]
MGDDIHKPVAIAAIIILLLLALLVRARGLFMTRGTSRRTAPPNNRRRLNTGVDVVPLSAVHVQQANHGGGDTNGQAHHPPPAHLRLIDSVTSIRYPPPAYPAHHLDPRYDAVVYGHGSIGHPVGRTVDVVLAPLPPPSYTTHPGGDHPLL